MYYSFIQKYQYIIKMNDFALRNKGANIAQATKQIFFARARRKIRGFSETCFSPACPLSLVGVRR